MAWALALVLALLASGPMLPTGAAAGQARLDEAAVRANLARWVARQEGAKAQDVEGRIHIERVVPVQDSPLPLFAVRLLIAPPAAGGGVPKVGVMLFDASGTYRFKGLNRLATGEDLVRGAMVEAMRHDLPAGFGHELADLGGGHDVVLVSDPFCPYCRKVWAALKKQRGRIGALRLVHLPLVGHEGSQALGWALDYAADQGMDAVAVADYVMSSLEQPGGGMFQGMDAALGALEALFAEYPAFAERLGPPEAAWKTLEAQYGPDNGRDRQLCFRLGLDAVPAVFVDGVLLRGYDPKRLRAMLDAD